MSGAAYSLRRQLVAAFALFALASALCFSVFAVLFVYSVEDSFFENMLEQEVAHQRRSWEAAGALVAPLRAGVSLHRSPTSFPSDLDWQPGGRREYPGAEGRHYHVGRVNLEGETAPLFLVAEVSRELVVRPRIPSLLSILGISMLAMLTLTLALGYWLARRATAPLTRLATLVSDAAPGQLPRGFGGDFPDNEIGILARQLDEAMARIAAFIEREQHFTRDASHELRTPLAVIDGAAQLMAQQPLAPQAAAQLQRIRTAACDMSQAVATLLSLAREELGPSAPEPVALLPLVEKAVVDLAYLLEGKPVSVSVEIDAGAQVTAPRAALAILLANLVGNAFSHSASGPIRIYIDGASLVMADSGPGIAQAVQERLYQSGVKGEASSGFGLGLSIAHRLAERSGIGLSIDSASGTGTRATLHFPN